MKVFGPPAVGLLSQFVKWQNIFKGEIDQWRTYLGCKQWQLFIVILLSSLRIPWVYLIY